MNKLTKLILHIKHGDLIRKILTKSLTKIENKKKFSKKYQFTNRSNNTEELVLILAGFQPYYWNVLLENIYYANKGQRDVCICIPGGEKSKLSPLYELAKKYNWSVLYIKQDKLGLVQNIAIKLHPNAKFIFKFDEDIIIGQSYFEHMHNSWNIVQNSSYQCQCIVPLININLAVQFDFLKLLNKSKEFEIKFGKHKIASEFMYKSKEVAEYFTRMVEDKFDILSDQIAIKGKDDFIPVPTRYSIGAMMFSRDFWNDIGFFDVGLYGQLGLEEEQVCAYAVNNWKPIICSLETFAAHLGYFVQKDICREIFEANPNGFKTFNK